MSQLLITLDDDLVARTHEAAESRGVSVDDLVAQSLVATIGENPLQKVEAMIAYAREHDFRISPRLLTREEANGRGLTSS